jgi:hypothetical protein
MKKIPSICYCGKEFDGKKKMLRHRASCSVSIKTGNNNRKEKSLENLKKAEEFKKKYPELVKQRHQEAVRNYQWTDEQRAIRSNTMRRVNSENREKFNKIRSKNAERTSMRPEIIKRRSAILQKWRDNNHEKFMEIMKKGQKAEKRSRAEEWMHENLLKDYKRNVQIRCGEKLKQVDFVKDNIWIEIDGCWHFGIEFSHKQNRFDPSRVHQRDIMLCNEASNRGNVILIRIGLGCWRGAGKRKLGGEWEKVLQMIIGSKKQGVWLLGKSYLQGLWEKDTCSIWKYVTSPTILPSLMG